MKMRYLTVLAVPALLGACSFTSSIDTQCRDDLCSTVFRNVGMTGDTFYTAVVELDGDIVGIGVDSQGSPIVPVVGSIIVGGSIIKGGAAFAKGMAGAIPEIPELPAMPPMLP